MASTTLPPRSPAPGNRPAPTLVPGGGRQRRWSLALLAILVTLGSALAFVVLWMNAGGREPVLALRNNVAAGQLIEADDIDAGSAVIAIPVPTSQIPVGDLETGDEVVLLRTISDAEATEAQTIGSGTVFSVQEDDDDAASDIRVSVIVAETLAAQVANAVSQDQIYVFKTPTG